jgi:hypothetical protein
VGDREGGSSNDDDDDEEEEEEEEEGVGGCGGGETSTLTNFEICSTQQKPIEKQTQNIPSTISMQHAACSIKHAKRNNTLQANMA